MKKILLGIVLFIVIMIGIAWVIKQKIGDIRPALLPAPKQHNSSNKLMLQPKKGEVLSIPLSVPQGYHIGLFAKNLGKARDLEFSPEGILLVSIPNEGTVKALIDSNNDGISDETKDILTGLDNPHGLAFYNGKLFVAEETKMVRYSWDGNAVSAQKEKELFDLPTGGRHTTRTIAFDKNGNMFVSIGSTCDVCYEKDERISTVMISDAEGKKPQIYAKGLRNAPFITIHPETNQLWGTEMGRDGLGDDIPPDEINIIQQNKDYGWPRCYGNKISDDSFAKSSSYCPNTESPIFEIQAHSAPLGLTFIHSDQFSDWKGDLLVAYHGSWNRSSPVGYKVVKLDVKGNTIVKEEDFVTGFLQGSQAVARPVDVIFDKEGNLYISDDKDGNIFIVSQK